MHYGDCSYPRGHFLDFALLELLQPEAPAVGCFLQHSRRVKLRLELLSLFSLLLILLFYKCELFFEVDAAEVGVLFDLGQILNAFFDVVTDGADSDFRSFGLMR
jgi:hypothetical protein